MMYDVAHSIPIVRQSHSATCVLFFHSGYTAFQNNPLLLLLSWIPADLNVGSSLFFPHLTDDFPQRKVSRLNRTVPSVVEPESGNQNVMRKASSLEGTVGMTMHVNQIIGP